jgi:hypothetical protein
MTAAARLLACFLVVSMFVHHSVADNAATYATPREFMTLYFDFTGIDEADFPVGKKTIPQYLMESEASHVTTTPFAGPLVLFLDSSLYIYDSNAHRLYTLLLRTNRSTGFFELTAVSHVGPALAYLAKIKENGSDSWRPALNTLLQDIQNVKAANAMPNNWLQQANIKAWAGHTQQIQSMVDYAMSMACSYIISVQEGAPFDLQSVQEQFLNGNEQYPIPYNSVMVATFMLTALQSMTAIHNDIADLNLDWSRAMVIIRNVAGANVTAGLTRDTNFFVPLVEALSGGRLPANRILIAPYAQVMKEVGSDPLPAAVYRYYVNQVWGSVYNRTRIARQVFTDLDTIYLPDRPAIPGDYGYSSAGDITDFMMRMKHSLQDSREMLSNTVGYWMAGELLNKGWDLSRVEIPGLTTGFPAGIKGYPVKNAAPGK